MSASSNATVLPSQTRIINGALAEIGSTTRLQSINDRGTLAADIRAIWPDMVRDMLEQHTWNFATKRTTVSLAEALPEGMGWLYAYDLPADCLRWLPPRRESGMQYFEAENEGSRVLTNAEAPLPIRFISVTLGENPSRWPPHFANLIKMELAARLADPVTQSETITKRTRDNADIALRRARRRDGMENGRDSRSGVTVHSDWLQGRERPYQFIGR